MGARATQLEFHAVKRSDGSSTNEPLVYGSVAVIVQQQRLLTIRRGPHVAAPGAICFPGGAIEAGEDSRTAVIRELREELSIDVTPIRAVWESVTPWQVHLTWWQCETDTAHQIRPNHDEVSDFRWLTLDQLRSQPDLLESNHHFLDALHRGEFSLTGL